MRRKRDRALVRDLIRLERELDVLEDLGADLTAREDPVLMARRDEAGIHEEQWSTTQVLAAIQAERKRSGRPPQLVVTLPVEIPIGHRTGSVVTKLLEEAQRRVLVMGFNIRERMMELLQSALSRGASVDLVLDPGQNRGLEVPDHANLRIWRPREGTRFMHAKVIVVDPGTELAQALVGSANFSESGLGIAGPSAAHNWEVGVLAGRVIADQLWTIFQEHLVGPTDRSSPGIWVERHRPG